MFQTFLGFAIVLLAVAKVSSVQIDEIDFVYFEGHLDGETTKFVYKTDSSCVGCHGTWLIFENHTVSLPNGTNLIVTTTLDSSIPDDLFKSFPNLESLQQTHQNIKFLKPWNFENAKQLHTVNLSHNGIEKIQMNVFEDASNLKVLDLSYNAITVLSNPKRTDFKFEKLYLHNNLLVEIAAALIPSSIRVVTLNNNYLKEIDKNATVDRDNLEHLDISNNAQLLDLNFTKFDSKYVDMSNISSKILYISQKARIIKANHNKISAIQIEGGELGICHIDELYLAHNEIYSVYMLGNNSFPSLKILDLSHNWLNFLSSKSNYFKKMVSLEVLNLSHNKLYSFDTTFLSDLMNLKVVDISHNILINFELQNPIHVEELHIEVNDLSDSSEDIFHNMPKLKRISFNKNNFSPEYLKKLGSILISKNITVLGVEKKNAFSNVGRQFIAGFTNDSKPMRCIYLKSPPPTCDQCEPFYDAIWFNVDNPYRNFQVWNLAINESSSSTIPKDIFFAFPNVQYFQMSHQAIKKLYEDDFENAKNLYKLNLSYNALEEINFGDFRVTEKLTIIDLSHNEISTIICSTHNTFEEIYLNNNRLVQYDCRLKYEMRILTLNDNSLKEIDWSIFADRYGDKFYERIDLSNNPELTSFEIIQFRSKHIVLSNTNSSQLFIVHKQQYIKAEYSNISKFRFEGVSDYRNHDLMKLLLAHNSITTLSAFELSGMMYDFKVLDVSYNLLGDINSIYFRRLPNLEKVNLSHNRLHTIEAELFSYKKNLKSIDVSFNALTTFVPSRNDENTFKYLNIEGNRLRELDLNAIRSTSNLKSIGLHDNDWNCQYLTLLIMSLQTIGAVPAFSYNVSLLSETSEKYDGNVYGIGCWKSS